MKMKLLFWKEMYMRFVEVKVFFDGDDYFIIIEKLNYKNNIKIIEQEFTKEFKDKNEIKYYITNVLNNKEFRKLKIFINYISNDVIIEVINENKETKTKYLEELEKLYPNYKNEFNLLCGEIKINANNKKIVCALLKYDISKNINNIISFVGKEKVYYGIDPVLLQTFINNNLNLFNKKYIIIIQKNFHFYRIYQIYNTKILNYVVLNEKSPFFKNNFEHCLKTIDNKVDELILDAPYSLYNEFIEKFFNVNVSFMDYQEKLKYLDERKIVYAKKKI